MVLKISQQFAPTKTRMRGRPQDISAADQTVSGSNPLQSLKNKNRAHANFSTKPYQRKLSCRQMCQIFVRPEPRNYRINFHSIKVFPKQSRTEFFFSVRNSINLFFGTPRGSKKIRSRDFSVFFGVICWSENERMLRFLKTSKKQSSGTKSSQLFLAQYTAHFLLHP